MFLQSAWLVSDHSSLNVAHHFLAYETTSRKAMHLTLGGDCVLDVASARMVENVAAFSVTKASSSLTCRTGDVS
jgi:hypothetical protein